MDKQFLPDKSKILNSFNAQKLIVKNLSLLPPGTQTTMMVIAQHYPNAYPSIATLVQISGKSRRQIFYDLKKLKAANFLEIKNRMGANLTSVYKINFDAFPKEENEKDTQCNGLHPPSAMGCTSPSAMDCTQTDTLNKQINKPLQGTIKNLIGKTMNQKKLRV